MNNSGQVLVTGGAGFIGSHLVEYLLRAGKRVTIIDDLSTGTLDNLRSVERHPSLKVLVTRVSACKELPELIAASEWVYHLAASVGVELVVKSPIDTIRNNVHETEVLLEGASRQGVPVLLTSSSEVYGKSQKPVFAETDDLLIGPPNLGRWRYACSKLMDEFLALAYAEEKKLPVVITRLFNIVGPRQMGRYGMVLPRFIDAARKHEPLRVFGDGRQTRCFCYVTDAVEALARLRAQPQARGEVVNVGGTEEITLVDLAELVIATLGSQSRIEFVPYEIAYAPGFEDMLRRKPLVEKLAAMTGFRPERPLREIIQLTAASRP
jgi:UDP-glucose 4-epimerase